MHVGASSGHALSGQPPGPPGYYGWPGAWAPYPGQPYYYGYPAAPPPPAHFWRPEHHSHQGLKFFGWALLAQMCNYILGFCTSLYSIIMLRNETTSIEQVGYILVTVLAIVILAGLLWLIWLIFMILGFVKSFMGQREHGRMQERNMLHALICFIMAVILPFMGSLVITVASFGAFLNSSGNDSAGTITWMILGSGLFSVAAAVLTALTYTKIIGAYAQGDGGNLKIAATLMVLNPVISLVVVALLLPGGISAGTVSSNLSGALSVGGIVGLLAVLLFYTVFRRVIARMDSGELGPGVVVPEETPGQVTVRERYRTPGGPRWPPMR